MRKNELSFNDETTSTSLNFFCDVVLNGRNISNQLEQEDYDAAYFSMCILLPEDEFLNYINLMFGDLKRSCNNEAISELAKVFNVNENLVKTRIKLLLDEKKVLQKKKKPIHARRKFFKKKEQ